jgi:hypothetical protein
MGQAYIKEGVNEADVFTLGPGRIYGAFFSWVHSRATLCKRQHSVRDSVCKRRRMNHQSTLRAHASYPEARSFTTATVRIYACLLRYGLSLLVLQCIAYTPQVNRRRTRFCFFRGFKNVVVLPAVGACQRVSCMPSSTNPPSR